MAAAFSDLFKKLDLPFYCKTSGGRGLHIYLPVLPKYSHEQAQQFARLIQMIIHKKFRKISSFERSPSRRKGKIYLDFLQNGRGKTMASVYCLRPRAGATVSTPVSANELNKNLNPQNFNIHTMAERIKAVGDLWKDLFDNRIDMALALDKLS